MKQTFAITATLDPQVLPRVLGLFAQRDLVPERLSSEVVDGFLHIIIELESLHQVAGEQILAKLQSCVVIVDAGRREGDETASSLRTPWKTAA